MLSKNTKFAIIGAGPAGLSAALSLKQNGYNNITVFEKESEFGGKCLSFHYNGKVFDLGANLTTPRYNNIRALATELGMTMRLPPERKIVNVGDTEYEDLTQASIFKKLLIRAGALYYTILRSFTGINKNGYAGLKSGVEKPFREWLKSHGLGLFQEMFEVLFVAYGYGHVMDLPAAYAMKFFDRTHINAAVNVILGKEIPTTMDFEEGFQELWKRVVSKYEILVKTSTDVLSIERNGFVKIKFKENGLEKEELFDKLIIACPLQNTKNFMDLSGVESELFSNISTYQYYSIVSKISGLPNESTYVYPYARVLTPGYPTVFYPPHKDGIYISYAYGSSDVTKETIVERLTETVEKLGGTLTEILHIQQWNYFPHINSYTMLNGFYDDIENIQGLNDTYFVGEIMSFTLIELIFDYCNQLIKSL